MSAENMGMDFSTASLPGQTVDNTLASETGQPVLEAVHFRKYFPLRQLKLFGKGLVVHAVEDTSLALYPGRALALTPLKSKNKYWPC